MYNELGIKEEVVKLALKAEEELKEAIVETFEHRNTSFDRIAAFNKGFADDKYRKGRWNGFIKTKRVDTTLTLGETIQCIKIFLEPILISIKNNELFNMKWNHSNRKWM